MKFDKWSVSSGARVVALLMAVVLTVVGSSLLTGTAADAHGSAKATTVAHTAKGSMTSKVVGTTSKGQRVTGTFTPLAVKNKGTTEKVRGLVQGVVHQQNGSTQMFSAMRTMKVTSLNGTPVSGKATNALATCNVLNLVLGPLDLNLLGLQIHLDKVVLNIVAVSGAGQLLGNLLCAVANLLNGGPLGGLLGQLSTLLNQILAALGLGL